MDQLVVTQSGTRNESVTRLALAPPVPAGLDAPPFRRLPRPVQLTLLVVELLAVLLFVTTLSQGPVGTDVLTRFAVLAVLAIVYAELVVRISWARAGPDLGRLRSEYTSVWAFAGALTLPAGWAAMLVVLGFVHVLLIKSSRRSIRPFRFVYTGASTLLASVAAAEIVRVAGAGQSLGDSLRGATVTLAAGIAFALVDLALLVVGALAMARPARFRAALPDRDAVGFAASAVLVGLVTAQFLLHSLWLTPIVLAVVAGVQRGSLVRRLRLAAATDAKTGLLNAATWRERAGQALSAASRSGQTLVLAVVDIDRFKQVNDTYGHLAGDEILVGVATTLRAESREHDLLGRFGGDEFVALLSGLDLSSALTVAMRWLDHLAGTVSGTGISVTASIGLAYTDRAIDADVDQLLQAADRALYAAKADGRGCVRSVVLAAGGNERATA